MLHSDNWNDPAAAFATSMFQTRTPLAYFKCESIVFDSDDYMYTLNSFLFTGSIVPISPVLWPKTWDIVYNKSNKSDDLHLKIVHQKTGQQTQPSDKMSKIAPVAAAAVQWLSWLSSAKVRTKWKVNNSSVPQLITLPSGQNSPS